MGHVNGNDGFRKLGCWVFLVAGQVCVTFSRIEFMSLTCTASDEALVTIH